jgi:hypothetical protein
VLVELCLDDFTVSDQDYGVAVLTRRLHRPLDYHKGGTITPHGINGDGHVSCPGRDLFLYGLDDFHTLVVAALQTHSVGQFELLALRTGRKVHRRQLVVGSPFIPPGLRMPPLGMSHVDPP